MIGFSKPGTRRAAIRESRPDTTSKWLMKLRADGTLSSIWIAVGFSVFATIIVMARENVVGPRPGQWLNHDIVGRVEFAFNDADRYMRVQDDRRNAEPHVFKPTGDVFSKIESKLLNLPDRVAKSALSELDAELRESLDAATLAKLQEYVVEPRRANWTESVRSFVNGAKQMNLLILADEQRRQEANRRIIVPGRGDPIDATATLSTSMRDELSTRLNKLSADNFPLVLQPKIVRLAVDTLIENPTHVLDELETVQRQNIAADSTPRSEGDITFKRNMPIVQRGEIKLREYQILRAENEAYLRSLGNDRWFARIGLAGCVLILSAALSAYIARFQPRVVRNHARGIGIAVLLLSMLLLGQLAGVGSTPLQVFGIAPTILTAMILAIAYDQRFAVGVGAIHAALITLALGAPMTFMLILWSGVGTCCILLDEVRTRSKLIEIGGLTALAMMVATTASGLLAYDPIEYILRNALYVGAAGLAVGFVILGILPFIERTFRITTSMTLLELADASHPLLRRMAMDAPGTYNHSLQVATLAEEAAEAIGANSLLCRVASYYHDVGKVIKPDYFIENQGTSESRHLNLNPNMSLLIIIGHVKDGIELARQYNLPTSIFPFIQQHHGTTLVEYFYHRAVSQQDTRPNNPQPAISEVQYRYPGPKPKSREIAVLMLADAIESATRAMQEPTAGRIESLVGDIAMRRLHDGQFDECDLTMRDLELIRRSLAKSLLGIYHGRIAYPSTSNAPVIAETSTSKSA